MYAPKAHRDALPTGTVIETIDGENARTYLDRRANEAWEAGGGFSSPQRARLYEYRIPLRGEKGAEHVLTYKHDGQSHRLVLESETEARGWPHTYNMPTGLTRVGRSFRFGKLPGEFGYMYLRRVDGSVSDGIRQALKTHSDVVGWIVDLRGNGGGGYDRKLIELIRTIPGPVAVLIDAGCMSAGETLARDFAREAKARVFGSPTAGSSSAKRTWRFPSGIASVSLPTRSRFRNDRRPIEYNGIEPDELVEPVPEELQKGLNSAILRAQEYIRSAADPD
jgi:C-terminal processing protease CtpA/Prc